MANSNNRPQRPSNPFAPPKNQQNNNTGNSRFGSRPSRFGSGNNNNNNSGGSRFGSSRLGSRNTREVVEWTITPMAKEVVGISLAGLGDPFHRLLGTPLNPAYSDPKKVVESLSKDSELLEQMMTVLDESWEKFNFRGVAMVYPMDNSIRNAYTKSIQPVPPPPPKEEKSDDDDEYYDDDDFTFEESDNNVNQTTVCLRAIDLLFVMNILARVRSNVVIGNTPLALEMGFLDQTLLCDDPRIVNLARATGCIEEVWD